VVGGFSFVILNERIKQDSSLHSRVATGPYVQEEAYIMARKSKDKGGEKSKPPKKMSKKSS
jgi:hypothetical protein